MLRQEYNTSDMAHRIPEMLEWMTWITTMEPGDVIACGTNHRGLGPLQDGETVEMEIGSFGKLTVMNCRRHEAHLGQGDPRRAGGQGGRR